MNYILTHRGPNDPQTEEVTKLLRKNDIEVLRVASPRLILVSGANLSSPSRLVKLLPNDWEITTDKKVYAIPTTRKRIERRG